LGGGDGATSGKKLNIHHELQYSVPLWSACDDREPKKSKKNTANIVEEFVRLGSIPFRNQFISTVP
jgi:hypothetical protein